MSLHITDIVIGRVRIELMRRMRMSQDIAILVLPRDLYGRLEVPPSQPRCAGLPLTTRYVDPSYERLSNGRLSRQCLAALHTLVSNTKRCRGNGRKKRIQNGFVAGENST